MARGVFTGKAPGGGPKVLLKRALRTLGLNPHRLKQAVLYPPKLTLLSSPLGQRRPAFEAPEVCILCAGRCVRRPAWPKSLLAQVADLSEIIRAGGRRFDFYECKDCGLYFRPVDAPPGPREGYYEEDYWPRARTERDYLAGKHREKTEVFRRVYSGTVKRWLEDADTRRVLEVGCFLGSWIYHLQGQGYEAEGVEPSRAAAEFGRSELGLPIRNGLYGKDLFEAGRLDAILCFHVLEHVPQPRSIAESLSHHLPPGGIVILEVPDIGPPGGAISPERLAICVADEQWRLSLARGVHEHYAIFNQRSIAYLLEQHGFEVKEMVTDPRLTSKENSLLVLAGRR